MPDGMVNRHEVMENLDHALNEPLFPEMAREYQRATWGLSSEAIRAASAIDVDAAPPMRAR
jgi:hypothetical protein